MTDQDKITTLFKQSVRPEEIASVYKEYIKERKGIDIPERQILLSVLHNHHMIQHYSEAVVRYYNKKLKNVFLLGKDGKAIKQVI